MARDPPISTPEPPPLELFPLHPNCSPLPPPCARLWPQVLVLCACILAWMSLLLAYLRTAVVPEPSNHRRDSITVKNEISYEHKAETTKRPPNP